MNMEEDQTPRSRSTRRGAEDENESQADAEVSPNSYGSSRSRTSYERGKLQPPKAPRTLRVREPDLPSADTEDRKRQADPSIPEKNSKNSRRESSRSSSSAVAGQDEASADIPPPVLPFINEDWTGSEATQDYGSSDNDNDGPESLGVQEIQANIRDRQERVRTEMTHCTDVPSIKDTPDVTGEDEGWLGFHAESTNACTPRGNARGRDMVDNNSVDIAFANGLHKLLQSGKWPTHNPHLAHDEVCVVRYFYGSEEPQIVVELDMNVLTVTEARSREAEVRQAIREELERWTKLEGFRRFPRAKATNLLDRS